MDVSGKLALQAPQQCANTGCVPGKECICIYIYPNNFGRPGSTVGENYKYIPAHFKLEIYT